MLILSVDTSCTSVGVGLARGGKILAENRTSSITTYSQSLLPKVVFLLTQHQITRNDIEGLAVTIGPGLFTSLRIGLATIQGFALGLGLKIAVFSTLRILAEGLCRYEGRIWVIVDAKRNLVYAASFVKKKYKVNRIVKDMAISLPQLVKIMQPPAILLGTGARIYASKLLRPGFDLADSSADIPNPGILALLGEKKILAGLGIYPEQLSPQYCRPSDAELNFGLPLNGYKLIE